MTREMIGPTLVGLCGLAILVSLGIWQVQRLAWKEGVLANIEARIVSEPVALPDAIDPIKDAYLPVKATGIIGTKEIDILASTKGQGAVYRIIAPFTVGARRVLLDRGFVPTEDKSSPRGGQTATVTGNLYWPDEVDSYTPAPDRDAGIWYARDIPAMAEDLGTEPVLIVARSDTGDGVMPFPVGTEAIPNDHLQYAITWFSLALVWLGMTLYQLWRIKRRTI